MSVPNELIAKCKDIIARITSEGRTPSAKDRELLLAVIDELTENNKKSSETVTSVYAEMQEKNKRILNLENKITMHIAKVRALVSGLEEVKRISPPKLDEDSKISKFTGVDTSTTPPEAYKYIETGKLDDSLDVRVVPTQEKERGEVQTDG